MATCYVEGQSFNHREVLKGIKSRAGKPVFSWEQRTKSWVALDVPDAAVGRLTEIVERLCPGLTIRQRAEEPKTNIDDVEIPF